MELILLEKVANLGDLGERVKVKPGFGRNFLVPQGKAIPATKSNVEYFESRREELEKLANEKMAAACARRDAMIDVTLEFIVATSPEGKLYGSIGPREIADRLGELGHAVEKSEVSMGEGSIRHIGNYNVPLHLHADVDAVVAVAVRSEDENVNIPAIIDGDGIAEVDADALTEVVEAVAAAEEVVAEDAPAEEATTEISKDDTEESST